MIYLSLDPRGVRYRVLSDFFVKNPSGSDNSAGHPAACAVGDPGLRVTSWAFYRKMSDNHCVLNSNYSCAIGLSVNK